MADQVVIDPVGRVEGHLRLEVDVDGGVVTDARVSSGIARGFEQIALKKDPRDIPLVAQRICGFCGAAHGVCGVLALDSLFGVDLPDNARFVRNLLMGADFVSSHMVRFYQSIVLDYVDVGVVLNYRGIESTLLALKKKVEKASNEADLHPFRPSLPTDELSIGDPAMATLLLTHYFEALEMRKKTHQIGALLGGRMPGFVGIVPGGVTHLASPDEMAAMRSMLLNLVNWINSIFLPDVIALATGPLLAFAQQGIGKGRANFLSVGGFSLDQTGKEKLFPAGAVFGGRLDKAEDVDSRKITEDLTFSWYEGARTREKENLDFELGRKNAYSFVKAPRYKGNSMEVGPLARLLIRKDETLTSLMQEFGIQPGVVARYVALVLECKIIAESMVDWLDELLENTKKTTRIWDRRNVPASGRGVGLTESPSGALIHRVEVEKRRVTHYDVISASTWNASPRDDESERGPLEEALIELPVPDLNNPLSVLRVAHSFNLCMSCGTH